MNTNVHLATQTGLGDLDQVGGVIPAERDGVADLIKLRNGNFTSLVEAIGNSDGMDSLIDKIGGLLQHGRSEDDDTGCSITNLFILGFRELNQELRNVVRDVHL